MAHRLRSRRRGIVLRVVRSVIGTVPLVALHETAHGRSAQLPGAAPDPTVTEVPVAVHALLATARAFCAEIRCESTKELR